MIRRLGLHLSDVHIAVGGIVVLAVVFSPLPLWAKIVASLVVVAIAAVRFDRWPVSEWVARAIASRRQPQLPATSEADLGAIAFPGEDVAVRWEGDELVGLVAVVARPLTPTVVVAGEALHDDVIDTRLVQESLQRSGIEVTADIVSAGWRVSSSAPAAVSGWGEELLGADPAPGFRRSWIEVRVDPTKVWRDCRWRGEGLSGVAAAVVSVATRLADDLAEAGVDARPAASFALFDELTQHNEDIVAQQWSGLRLKAAYTTVFTAPGPNDWWSARAVRTVTRTRVRVGQVPQSVVALTTLRPIERDPDGWTRLRGVQMQALRGDVDVAGSHQLLPVGSAGVLVGRTALDGAPVYVPFDAADSSMLISDTELALRMAVRACAAGAQMCLPQDMAPAAAALGVLAGPKPHYRWPGSGATTWLSRSRDGHEITLRPLMIELPVGPMPLRSVDAREDAVIGVRLASRDGHSGRGERDGSKLAAGYGRRGNVIERSSR